MNLFHRFLCAFLLYTATSGETAPVPIGSIVENFSFKDIRYLNRDLNDFGKKEGFVIFVTSLETASTEDLKALQRLEKETRNHHLQWLAIHVGPQDTIQEMAWRAIELDLPFPVGLDQDGASAQALGVSRIPTVVLLNAEKKLLYRGTVLEPGPGKKTSGSGLKSALQSYLQGERIRVTETKSSGKKWSPPSRQHSRKEPNYTEDVAPILARHCGECHQSEGVAPFPLVQLEQVRAKASMIAEVVRDQRMPPWFAHPQFGSFANERRLSDSERQILLQWAEGKREPGPLKTKGSAGITPASTWKIGPPDLVITALHPEKIPARGYIDYRYITLPYVFPHDTWIQGAEIRPSNPRVMHHGIVGYALAGANPNPEETIITGQVPGGEPLVLTRGIAKMIPKGSQLVLEMHYVTTGKEETDQLSVGLRFARETVQKQRKFMVLEEKQIAIPPGDGAHPMRAHRTLETDIIPLEFLLHMHLRGKDSVLQAELPNGHTYKLLVVPNYSFDWQTTYRWRAEKVQAIPKGARLQMISHFDNSAFNPYNPDPSRTVNYGRQTHEEMMAGWFYYVDQHEKLAVQVDPKNGREIGK